MSLALAFSIHNKQPVMFGFEQKIHRWITLLTDSGAIRKCFFHSNPNIGILDNRCAGWSGMGGKQSFYDKELKTCSSHFAFKIEITCGADSK